MISGNINERQNFQSASGGAENFATRIYPVRVLLMFIVLPTLTGEAASLDAVNNTENISETLTGCKNP